MAKLFDIKRVNGVADDTVKAKTGKKWEEWFKMLDKAGARMMDHQEIAQLVDREFGLTPWWRQLLTVGYEQDRGIRQKHQRGTQYEVDRSRTVAGPVSAVWAAFHDPATLERWLPGVAFQVARSTPHKILHLDWPDKTRAVVMFSEKSGKTKVVISHERLKNFEDIERLQSFWSAALDRLQQALPQLTGVNAPAGDREP
jgi:hypothetical protein